MCIEGTKGRRAGGGGGGGRPLLTVVEVHPDVEDVGADEAERHDGREADKELEAVRPGREGWRGSVLGGCY